MSVTGQMVEDSAEFAANAERRAIVNWLRAGANGRGPFDLLTGLADAIERGLHWEWVRRDQEAAKSALPEMTEALPARHAFVHKGRFRVPLEQCVECGHIYANDAFHNGRTKRAPKPTRKKGATR